MYKNLAIANRSRVSCAADACVINYEVPD